MRFKPPPLGQLEIGWRVEFRPMELQLTDTENAALVIFIVLLTRLILSFNLNLLIPMSKVMFFFLCQTKKFCFHITRRITYIYRVRGQE